MCVYLTNRSRTMNKLLACGIYAFGLAGKLWILGLTMGAF